MAEISLGTYLLIAASGASAYYVATNQPKLPELPPPPDFSNLQDTSRLVDRTQLQEEAELRELQLGETDEERKRKRGREKFVVDLAEDQQADREDDPAGIQLLETQEGVSLGGEQAQSGNNINGVQI